MHYIFTSSIKVWTKNYLHRMSLILKVPTLNDEIHDFERLFSLHQQAINSDKEHLILDFSDSLSLVDFGVGIPHKVRTHLQQQSMAAEQAIEWAIAPGNSTRPNLVPKGMGLDTLRDFVTGTGGKLEIFSDNGYTIFNRNGLGCGRCSTTLARISRRMFSSTLTNPLPNHSSRRYARKPF